MTNKDLANVLFPNITKTVEDYKNMYPKRELKEGEKVQDLHHLQQDSCI